ncbi:hypothetical protein [Posidoniimonas corsicana]|uniref:hypothetical protein n=1 Tax=Posidoniimonas corsicana TaxID=1938618 RepID=UPI0011B6A43C|nr:hypothetical protein [Posidoniimonas corsicana]
MAVWGPFRFTSSAVCSHCGSIRYTVERQFPFTTVPYWRSRSIESTPLSDSVGGLLTSRDHTWQFAHGGGNGVRCALGEGRSLLQCTDSALLIGFLEATKQHSGADAARHYLNLALDPTHSEAFMLWLAVSGFQPDTHRDPAAYAAWFQAAVPQAPEFGNFPLLPADQHESSTAG